MAVGYAAPIDVLIGLDLTGTVTAIKILDYTESYRYSRGDFIDDAGFLAQFRNKSLDDEYRLNRDIDGLSAASLTAVAIARSVGETARRVARAYLDYGTGDAAQQRTAARVREQLSFYDWSDLVQQGIVTRLQAGGIDGRPLSLAFTYGGHAALGEYFIGREAYTQAMTDASFKAGPGQQVLIAVSGPGAGPQPEAGPQLLAGTTVGEHASAEFRWLTLSVQQDELIRYVADYRYSAAGRADQGAVAGQADYALLLTLHPDFDITRPLTFIYHSTGPEGDVRADFALSGVGLSLARNEPLLSDEELLARRLAEAGWVERLWLAPPWGTVPLLDVLLLCGVLILVSAAFASKRAELRWAALLVTLFYLGFYKNGFLSVSHITSVIKQGPAALTHNFTVLMIALFTLITTLLWGRVFCSSLCPFGALQDVISRLTPKRWRITVPRGLHDRALYIKYGILALILVAAVVVPGVSLFQYFEPFGTVFFFSSSLLLWSILGVVLIGCVVVTRFYCRYVCPLGAALGVLSLLSPLRIRRVPQCSVCRVCEQACPTGAIRAEAIDFKECVRCDVCEAKLLKRAGSCRHTMAEIDRRRGRPPVDVIPILVRD
jgi:ferredoxin